MPILVVLPKAYKSARKERFVRAEPQSGHHAPLVTRKTLWLLMGTGGTWFLFDVLFFGNMIFAPEILQTMFEFDPKDLDHIVGFSSIVAVIGCKCLVFFS